MNTQLEKQRAFHSILSSCILEKLALVGIQIMEQYSTMHASKVPLTSGLRVKDWGHFK